MIGLAILITYDFDPFDFRSSWLLIPIIHSAIALPFVIRAALPVVQGIPNDLRLAAATLGAGPWRRLLTVEIPLLRPAISTGFAFSLAMSLNSEQQVFLLAANRALSPSSLLDFSVDQAKFRGLQVWPHQ